MNATNSWSDEKNHQGMITDFLDKFTGQFSARALGENIRSTNNEIQNFINSISSGGDANRMSRLDLAKYYSYPTDGERITITFTLFNTVKKGEWKKNFNFIYLFCLRNKLLKLDSLSFEPPYLYDIFIPGAKRLPLSYVGSYTVTPKGIIRNLAHTIGEKEILAPVPEAWEVSIEFVSLIPQSANLMLSALYDFPITVNSVRTEYTSNN